jgi:hypothetical protein
VCKRDITRAHRRAAGSSRLQANGDDPETTDLRQTRISGRRRHLARSALRTQGIGDRQLRKSTLDAEGLARIFQCAVRNAPSFSGCESRPATVAPAGSNRSNRGGTESIEAFGVEGRQGSWQSCRRMGSYDRRDRVTPAEEWSPGSRRTLRRERMLASSVIGNR